MKTLVLVSFGSLIGLAWSPGLDPADVSVPCSRTDSTLLSSSSSFAPVRFLGEHAAADVAAYGDLLAVALAPQNPVVQPVAPASALPSQGGTNCSAGTTNNNASCSTDANQTTCSANGDGHNCSAGNNAPGVAKCSAHTGDSGNRCSIHAGDDAHCSAGDLWPGGAGTSQCSAFDAGFCSVFGGGGNPGGNGGGGQGGQDNSCSAFGPRGKTPKCSAFATSGIPLCSVLKDKANATCTVVDSEIGGAGAGTCSTMDGTGAPIGPPNLCSVISLGPPVRITPPVNGRCTTTKVVVVEQEPQPAGN